jgi:hypothetical protein
MESSEITAIINEAFRGVCLEGGTSLRRAAEADITDEWTAISFETLEHFPYLAHLDAEGFRYHIPAFLLSVPVRYDRFSMRVISTLSSLYPKKESWDYHLGQYSLLDREQRRAIALYLTDLGALIELDQEDQKVMARALRNYWQEFL